jgi:hypothetical protein
MQLLHIRSLNGQNTASPQQWTNNEPRTPGFLRSPGFPSDQTQRTFLPTPVARPPTARIPITLTDADPELDLESGRKRAVKVNSIAIDEDILR